MKERQIIAEVRSIIDRAVEQGEASPPQAWLVHSVVQAHQQIEGGDKDFYVCCAYGHVATCVRKALRLEKETEMQDNEELLLPGFKRLHRRYSVERGGEQRVVPVDAMTPRELRAKAQEYVGQARGLNEHADELIRYATQREAREAA